MSDAARKVADLIRGGRSDEARAQHAAAVSRDPEDAALMAIGAALAMQSGDPAGAVPWLERLVARHPEDQAPRLHLAGVLTGLDRFAEVEAVCARLKGQPDADRLLAFAALRSGRSGEAAMLYRSVLAARPDDAGSWANLGNILAADGDAEAAIQAYEEAITHRRGERGFYLNLAGLLERLGRDEARARVLRDAAAIFTTDAEVQLAHGMALMANAPADAEAALRRAIILAPDRADGWISLGLLLEGQNRLDALSELIAAARAHVGPELALLEGLLALRRNDPAAAVQHAAAVPAGRHDRRRAALQGMAAEQLGAHAAAFSHYAEMNRVVEAQSPAGSPDLHDSLAEAARALAAAPAGGTREPTGRTPVFVLGVPRSGTTLLDTLLSRLPDTRVLEEQSTLQHAAALAVQDGSERARTLYWSAVERHLRDGSDIRVIDKHPFHLLRVPALNAIFPGAPILFVERHPCDVVLSCFTTDFRLKHAMRGFTNLVEAAHTYSALMDLWTQARQQLDLNVHVVRYERLVTDPQAEFGAALRFLGIDIPAATVLEQALPRERGLVRTASYAQVNVPITTSAMGRWRRFEAETAPILAVLRPWVEKLGYDL